MSKQLTISEILQRLMFTQKLSTAELARQTAIPQPTLHRIVNGISQSPRKATLEALTAYFDLTPAQLTGESPIAEIEDLDVPVARWQSIPIIDWPSLTTLNQQNPNSEAHILVEQAKQYSKHSFAVHLIDNAMEPMFTPGTLIIIDPEQTVGDRTFVLVKLGGTDSVVLRRLVMDGDKRYIKAISPLCEQHSHRELTVDDIIMGVLVQARHEYTHRT